jgi:hypothetical protein
MAVACYCYGRVYVACIIVCLAWSRRSYAQHTNTNTHARAHTHTHESRHTPGGDGAEIARAAPTQCRMLHGAWCSYSAEQRGGPELLRESSEPTCRPAGPRRGGGRRDTQDGRHSELTQPAHAADTNGRARLGQCAHWQPFAKPLLSTATTLAACCAGNFKNGEFGENTCVSGSYRITDAEQCAAARVRIEGFVYRPDNMWCPNTNRPWASTLDQYPIGVTDPSKPAGCLIFKGQCQCNFDDSSCNEGPTIYHFDAYAYYFNSLDSSAGSGNASYQPVCAIYNTIASVKGVCTR